LAPASSAGGRRPPLALLSLACSLAGCWGGGSTPTGQIVYVSERGGAPVVHVVRADGTDDRALRVCPSGGFSGPADPRGQAALVICAIGDVEADHQEQLRLVPLAGGEPRDLGPPARMLRNPAWAPDGAFLVFESDAASFRDLYRIARDGTGLERLTDNEQGNFEPSVDPSGRRIAFVSSRDLDAELYIAGSDGTGQIRRTAEPGDDMKPVWSPNGKELAYIAMRGATQQVQLIDVETGASRPLMADPGGLHQDVSWSADGEVLAITLLPAPSRLEVWTVTRAGEVLAKFGEGAKASYPSWSPDGMWLALSWEDEQGANVLIATRDGRTRKRLTAGRGPDWLPRWQRAP
jgi:TolB protein